MRQDIRRYSWVWPRTLTVVGSALRSVSTPSGTSRQGACLRGLRVSLTLSSEARDIGAEVPGFVAAKLHVGHLGVWIHQELRYLFRAEPAHRGDRGKRRGIICSPRLIIGYNVAGCAPTFGQLFAVGCIGGQSLGGQRPSAHAESKDHEPRDSRTGSMTRRVYHVGSMPAGCGIGRREDPTMRQSWCLSKKGG